MAFCSFSSKLVAEGYTVLDNTFINEFLPPATGDDVKVYLYGLAVCSSHDTAINNLEDFAKVLSLTTEQVENAFFYWNEMGLVQVVSKEPFEVRYLPAKSGSGSVKIRNKEKYNDFNKQIQSVLSARMISPVEYNEYYTLIEKYHFEPEALVLIAKYCTNIKGSTIGYPYILAVARDFDRQGLKTFEAVEEKFLEQERNSKEIKQILQVLGIKREADIDERNLYLKWTNNFGFSQGVIVEIAKSQKKRGGFAKLDKVISKYYEQKLFSMQDITNFTNQKNLMDEIARSVCKNLGLYYQDYDAVVTVYVSDWLAKGFDKETLEYISTFCFRQNIHSLEKMNDNVQKFFKQGYISIESIKAYIDSVVSEDEKIKEILEKISPYRLVINQDRNLYKTWTRDWGFEHESLLLVAEFSKDKSSPTAYMNKILANIKESGKTKPEDVKKQLEGYGDGTNKTKSKAMSNYSKREYSKEELSAVLDSLDDVEL